ncbi:uncharacterized protein EI90DRAFT_3052991 [Cantharellus anzutake]|uniref:uncharacterized protein n=1 Tax=Cantharellus anzutake TaxID=1750568 RepID=UPI00190344CE|nr:uncharacterized protein EI90DRAFT_3052991 [Cantharellus anzutake]KAF8333102.1 hypothetical protein EI90DRAFT_3052991 [Cantharellus anzutake]
MASASSASLTPGQACLECRRRKVKCDGSRPVCGRCDRLRKECEYEQIVRRLQVDIMEDRLSEIESGIQAYLRRPASMEHPLMKKLTGDGGDRHHPQNLVSPFLPLYTGEPRSSSTVVPESNGSVTSEALLAGYGSVTPRTIPESGLGQIGVDSELPAELSEYLIRMALPFRNQFHMNMHLPRLLFRSRLPPTHPDSIHPALLNSIYLAVCSTSGGQMAEYESRFLTRTRTESERALGFVDRLVHFMWASVILASYYIRRGRIVEAHNTISGTVSFAVAAGLHRAPDVPHGTEVIVLPPADAVETQDRVALWHALTQLEASSSLRTGFQTIAPKDHQASIRALFFAQPAIQVIPSVPHVVLQTKASALLMGIREYLVAIKDVGTAGLPPAATERYSMLVTSLRIIQQEIPAVDRPLGLQSTESVSKTNPAIVQLHCYVNLCSILLYNAAAAENPRDIQLTVRSAESMARACSAVRRDEPLLLIQAHPDLVWCLHSACEVLIRDFMTRRAQNENNAAVLEEREAFIKSVFDVLNDLIGFFPSSEPVIGNLPQLLLGGDQYETI